jgi:sulfofructose kinase
VSAAVSCVGVAVLDLVYGVERLPTSDDKIQAHSRIESGGGMAANAAAAVARLGGTARWFGRLGDDAIGDRILGGLAQAGVDAAGARRLPGQESSHSVILVDGAGNRAIILYRSESLSADANWLPLPQIVAAGAVLADIRWVDGAVRALEAARRAGRPAILDADISKDPRALDAARVATHAVYSMLGLAGLFGTDDPAEGLRLAAAHTPFVAVTLGAQGVLWRDPDGAVRLIPAFPVVAQETLGAGDVFHGAFALGLAEGRSEPDALRFAAAAAAIKCARTGARDSFPFRHEVDSCLQQAR